MGREPVPLKHRSIPMGIFIPFHAVVTIEKYCIAAGTTTRAFLKQYIVNVAKEIEKQDVRLTHEEEQLLRAKMRKIMRTDQVRERLRLAEIAESEFRAKPVRYQKITIFLRLS